MTLIASIHSDPDSGREFEWSFLQADVSFPILGVDFLRSNRLLVDVASNTLVDSATGDTLALTRRPSGYTATVMLPAPGGVRTTPQRTYADVAGSTPSRSSPRPAAAAEAASQGGDAGGRHVVAEEVQLGDGELALLRVDDQASLAQTGEDVPEVGGVLLGVGAGDQDVVQVGKPG